MATPDLPEVNKVVDQLIKIIRRHHRSLHGKSLNTAEVAKEANDAIKRRLS